MMSKGECHSPRRYVNFDISRQFCLLSSFELTHSLCFCFSFWRARIRLKKNKNKRRLCRRLRFLRKIRSSERTGCGSQKLHREKWNTRSRVDKGSLNQFSSEPDVHKRALQPPAQVYPVAQEALVDCRAERRWNPAMRPTSRISQSLIGHRCVLRSHDCT